MNATVRQRGRIARVRRVQHNIATVKAARAQRQVTELEASAEHLARLRASLAAQGGQTFGAALAGVGELAERLEQARAGLGKSIVNARAIAGLREGERMAAHRDQESAERLGKRAIEAAEKLRERRLAGRPRRRPGLAEDGE